jgi:hypothetical protein
MCRQDIALDSAIAEQKGKRQRIHQYRGQAQGVAAGGGVGRGVLPERLLEADRLVLWLPGARQSRVLRWEKLSTAARSPITLDRG